MSDIISRWPQIVAELSPIIVLCVLAWQIYHLDQSREDR
jgi:hypothetical protein